MVLTKKPETRHPKQVTGKENQKTLCSKVTLNKSFLIEDSGIISYFDKLERIAETRENPNIRQELLNLSSVLQFSFGELLEQIEILYKDKNDLQEKLKTEYQFVIYLGRIFGFNPNKFWLFFEVNEDAKRVLQESDKTTQWQEMQLDNLRRERGINVNH